MPDSIQLQNGQLDPASQSQYWDDGYLFPIRALSDTQARAYRDELEAVEDRWLDADLPLPLNTYKRVNAHCVLPMAWRLASEPAILDVVEGILGPDIMIYAAEFFIKEANTPQIVTMHQDLTYWGLGAIDGIVTAWIALSPATSQSGCMDFVRASHKNPILPHVDTFDENNLLSRGQEVRVDVADKDKVAIELQPGQFSLHHGLTIHGSGHNVSDDRRIAAVVRYCRPDISQKSGNRDYATLVRGTDTAGHFTPVPEPRADFDPEALRFYEQIRADHARIIMKDAGSDNSLYGTSPKA